MPVRTRRRRVLVAQVSGLDLLSTGIGHLLVRGDGVGGGAEASVYGRVDRSAEGLARALYWVSLGCDRRVKEEKVYGRNEMQAERKTYMYTRRGGLDSLQCGHWLVSRRMGWIGWIERHGRTRGVGEIGAIRVRVALPCH